MPTHRLRRWPNLKPTSVERLVFAGIPLHNERANKITDKASLMLAQQ